MNLLLAVNSQKRINNFISTPAQALIIQAPAGSGKLHTAKTIASELVVNGDSYKLSARIKIISPENNVVSIDQIRDIRQFLKLKALGNAPTRRAVIVENAGQLTIEAQNAFLKMLEEPPASTVIILTVSSTSELLPTILSRTALITLDPVSKLEASKFFESQGFDAHRIASAYALSEGRIGLLNSILNHQNDYPLLSDINYIKFLLAKSPYERLLEVGGLAADKEAVKDRLSALEIICRGALRRVSQQDNVVQVKRWQANLKHVYKAQDALLKNANLKLLLCDLLINL